MSPVDLPGAPLSSPRGSNKSVKCPRCSHVQRGGRIESALKNQVSKDVRIKCKNCGYQIVLKKLT